ncbi:MAG: hypothetical protein ACHP7O_09155 [Burkholderiales bacterium]
MKTTLKAIVLATSLVAAGSVLAQNTDVSSLNDLTNGGLALSADVSGATYATQLGSLISTGGTIDTNVALANDSVAIIAQFQPVSGTFTNVAFIDQSGTVDNLAIISQITNTNSNTAAIMQVGGANHAVINQH